MMPLVLALAIVAVPQDDKIPPQVDLKTTCEGIHEILVDGRTGNLLAFGEKGYAAMFSVRNGEERRLPLTPKTDLMAATLTSDGQKLALAGKDGLVHVLDAKDLKAARTWPDDELFADGALLSVATSNDMRLLASGGMGKVLRLYDLDAKKELAAFKRPGSPVTAIAFSPDGKVAACGSQAGRVFLLDPRSPDQAREIKAHEGAVTGLEFGVEGKELYSSSLDGTVQIIDVAAGAERKRAKPLDGPIREIRLAEKSLLVAGAAGRIAMLNSDDLGLVKELPGERVELTAAAMDPRGRFAAASYRGGLIRRFFLPKILAGDDGSTVPGAEYETPAASAGLVLRKGESGGCQVERILLGFDAPKSGPAAGDVITHLEQYGSLNPVTDPASFKGDPGEWEVKFRSKAGEEKVGKLVFFHPEEVQKRAATVKALLQDELPPEFGLSIDELVGTLYRVDPDGPSAGKIPAGCVLLRVNGKPWGHEAHDELAKRRPVEVEYLTAEPGVKKALLTPGKPPAHWRLLQLAIVHLRAGDKKKSREFAKEAQTEGERSWRHWVEIARVERAMFPEKNDARKALEAGLKKAAYKAPIVDLLAGMIEDKDGVEPALALLAEHPPGDDILLELRRCRLLASANRRQEAIAGFEALVRRGVHRARLDLGWNLQQDNRPLEAIEAYRRYFYENEPPFNDKGEPNHPKYGSTVPEYQHYLDLCRKHKR